jgi:hypothetical protein
VSSTTLLTLEDFNENVEIELGINNGLSIDNLDNYQVDLTFENDGSLTATNEDRTSPIVFTSIDSSELLLEDAKDYLEVVIDLNNDDLTGSQQRIVLTVFDSEQLGDRESIDPLTGETINSTNSELIIAIDSSNSNINEENGLLLETGGFTLNLDSDISSIAVSDPLESEDSLLSFGSIGYHYSDSSTDIISSNDGELLTITQISLDSTINF